MSDGLVDIWLHGPLADKYGQRHAFAVRNAREAVRALSVNYRGFERDFIQHGEYLVVGDGEALEGEQAAIFPVVREIHFCPRVEGGAFLGAALVGAIFPGLASVTIGGVSAATIIGGALFAGLMLGVSLLLKPSLDKPTADDTPKDENFAFSGPENVTVQGATVPLIYGRVHAGSVVVSAGLELGTVAQSITAPAPAPKTGSSATQPGLGAPPGGFPAPVSANHDRGGGGAFAAFAATTVAASTTDMRDEDDDTDYYIPDENTHPDGWVCTQIVTISIRPDDGGPLYHKLLRIYTPGNNPLAETGTGRMVYYAWNELRGYYELKADADGTEAAYTPQDEEWIGEGESYVPGSDWP